MKQMVLYQDLTGLIPHLQGLEPWAQEEALTETDAALTSHCLETDLSNTQQRTEASKQQTRSADFIKFLSSTTPIYLEWVNKKKNEKVLMLFKRQVDKSAKELSHSSPLVGSLEAFKRQHEEAHIVTAYNMVVSTKGNSVSLQDSLSLRTTEAFIILNCFASTYLCDTLDHVQEDGAY
eukprot:jgi/Psemu1/30717/gm1.30717_g